MKIAYSLFGVALVWLLIFPLGAAYSNYADYQKNGTESDVVVNFLKKYQDVVSPASEIVERNLKVGFIEILVIQPGFHLIHDPSLEQEVLVKGPSNVFDIIEKHQFPNHRFHFMFNQAIKLEAPVVVRMNLNAHHVGSFRLSFYAVNDRDNWTNFTTLGPLTGHDIEIGGQVRSDADILVDADELSYNGSRCQPCMNNEAISLVGRADKLALPKPETTMDYAKLNVKTFQRSFQAMTGRKLNFEAIDQLKIIYDVNPSSTVEDEKLNFRPDTFYVGQETEVSVQFRAGEYLMDTNEAVIIRQ